MQRQEPFRLYIPEADKANLYALLLAVRDENQHKAKKRRKFRKYIRAGLESIGTLQPVDYEKEWQNCIQIAENSRPQTIFEFYTAFAKAAQYRFYVNTWGGHGAPKKDEAFAFSLHTSLTKSLYLQFAEEPNIYHCTETLSQKVPNATCVYWDQIDTSEFNIRVRAKWAAFHTLMICSPSYYRLHKSLLNSAELTEDDFITAFFAGHALPNTGKHQNHLIFSHDVLMTIAMFVSPEDLHNYRQVSHHAYNAVEHCTTARLKHRLHVVSKNALLKDLIGPTFYADDKFLITDPDHKSKHQDYNYRLISLTPPYQTRTYFGLQGQFERMIGAHAQQDPATGVLTLLSAYKCSVYSNHFKIHCLKLPDMHAKYNREDIRTVEIYHDRKEVEDFGHHTPIWERNVSMKVENGLVSVGIRFTAMTEVNGNHYSHGYVASNVTEYHEAEFAMEDFEKPHEKIMAFRK